MIFERADIVLDANVMTAQPWAYRSYAAPVDPELTSSES
jgi:hypothetical protein